MPILTGKHVGVTRRGFRGVPRHFRRTLHPLLLVTPLCANAQQPQFIPLGGGASGGISADGGVIVGHFGSPPPQAARWSSSTGWLPLGVLPGGNYSGAQGVSLDGSQICGSGDTGVASAFEPFIWSAITGMLALGAPPGITSSDALGVSLDGLVVAGTHNYPGYKEAFRWTASTGMVGLGGLPGQPVNSLAFASNADGSVIVGFAFAAGIAYPVRWTAATGFVSLGLLPGYSSGLALDVSADGNVVVGRCNVGSHSEAFRWTSGGGMVALGDLPGGAILSTAFGVSASGLVTVGDGRSGTGDFATFWTPTQGPISIPHYLTSLGVTAHNGWQMQYAASVSADGLRIVGGGQNPAGLSESWLVILPHSWTEYCTAKLNSLGCTPTISATGVPSASNAWSFVVRATPVLNQTAGLFFYKVGGGSTAVPFQGGTLCVGPGGIRRTPVVNSLGNPQPAHDCSGAYTLDMNAFAQGQLGGNPDPTLLTPGTIYRIQAWGRDRGFAPPNNTSLSNALQVPIGP